jgi:hypothetical protein
MGGHRREDQELEVTMRRLVPVVLIAALVGGSALALSTRYASENQSTTRSAPVAADFDATNTDGSRKALILGGVQKFYVSVCAASGQTLSGAGTLAAYLYDRQRGKVKRNPSLDQTITVTSTSCGGSACRCQVFPVQEASGVPDGDTLIYAANGVTVSGGTTVDIEYTAVRQ